MDKKLLFFLSLLLVLISCKPSKEITNSKHKNALVYRVPTYRGAYTRLADLVHTKLFITPIWNKKEIQGLAEITLHQHFYPSDSIQLNARSMKVYTVELRNDTIITELKFTYDSEHINIHLPKIYKADENITLKIAYSAYPENVSLAGTGPTKKEKGFYFINADSSSNFSPSEFWTQGETESNSVWFPTIESPEQKTTWEIFLTVDSALTTLSNGLLIDTKYNNDNTKTDHWNQNLPAAPYLIMIAAGNFSIVKDYWKGKEVSYYVDPPYEKYARLVFGNTPEMIEYFSNLTGIPFPWQKYSQIVVHDYISGAMENVSAVVHGTNMQQDPGDYKDDSYEDYIAHELFHHWFGNLVTCRSWANITLNEGFANYSEYLWRDYKYGRTNAESHLIEELNYYLLKSTSKDLPLIRYYYDDKEQVYDFISYNKGGCILNMLRNYLGDSAFFKSLNFYLNTYQYSSAEVDQLRAAFEKISGEDLNWFFNQWFKKGGHPQLTVTKSWSDVEKKETVKISQTQNLDKYPLYRLPLAVDFYFNDSIIRKNILFNQTEQTFYFPMSHQPEAMVVDGDRTLVGTIKTERNMDEKVYLYNHSKNILDRLDVINEIGVCADVDSPGSKIQVKALDDPSDLVRKTVLNYTTIICKNSPLTIQDKIIQIALHDSSTGNRSIALENLFSYYPKSVSLPIYEICLKDISHLVVATAFEKMWNSDAVRGRELAKQLENDSSSEVLTKLTSYYTENDSENVINVYKKAIQKVGRWDKYSVAEDLKNYLTINKNITTLEQGIDLLFSSAKNSTFSSFKKYCLKYIQQVQSGVYTASGMSEKEFEKWKKSNLNLNSSQLKEKLLSLYLSTEDKIIQLQISN